MQVIRTVHDTYRELQNVDGRYGFRKVAEQLGISQGTLTRHIDRFEEALTELNPALPACKVFHRGTGRRPVPICGPHVLGLMRDVADLVAAYDRVISTRKRRINIAFGASLTASNYFAPRLFEAEVLSDVSFDLRPARSLQLRQMLETGECDLALVAISPDSDVDQSSQVVTTVDLPMALICPRGHWTERHEFNWECLAQDRYPLVLLKEEPDRYPMPKYPISELPDGLVVTRLGATSICNTLVMSDRALTITLPQFFTQRQRDYMNVVFDDAISSIRLALIRVHPRRMRDATAEKENRLNNAAKVVAEELQRLEQIGRVFPVTQHATMYYVTRMGTEFVWMMGRLQLRFDGTTAGGFFALRAPGEPFEIKEFTLRGQVIFSPTDTRCHVGCRGRDLDGEDEFVMEAMGKLKDGKFKRLVGIWAGRPTRDLLDNFAPFVGNLVIATNENLSVAKLNRLVALHQRRYALPLLDVGAGPEVINELPDPLSSLPTTR